MADNIIDIKPGILCRRRLTKAIKKIEGSVVFKASLESPSCDPKDPKGLISRNLHFRGKGRDVTIKVTLNAKAMAGLLRAIRKRRSIQVTQSSDSKYSGSYRSYAQQGLLYREYKAGIGHKAAHPCSGYHRQGRAVDLYLPSWEEREAMLSVRVDGLQFYDGLSFGDPPHFTLGAKG